jgi:hypothetical protein
MLKMKKYYIVAGYFNNLKSPTICMSYVRRSAAKKRAENMRNFGYSKVEIIEKEYTGKIFNDYIELEYKGR